MKQKNNENYISIEHTRQKYLQDILSLVQFGVLTATPSNGPNLVPRGITPVLQTPSVFNKILYKICNVRMSD